MMKQYCLICLMALLTAGCASTRTTDTSRTGMEQLLISNATDQALNKIDFRPLDGKAVFLQDKYVDGVDKNYVVGSIRHRLLAAGAQVVDKADDADVIVEARSGGIGTDRTEGFVGMPQFSVPGPMPLFLPEIRLFNRKTQTGTAKIGLVAYDAKTKQSIGEGAVALARSDDNNWYVLGVGPFSRGSVKNEVVAATGGGQFSIEHMGRIAFRRDEPSMAQRLPLVKPTPEQVEAAGPEGPPIFLGPPQHWQPQDQLPPANVPQPPASPVNPAPAP